MRRFLFVSETLALRAEDGWGITFFWLSPICPIVISQKQSFLAAFTLLLMAAAPPSLPSVIPFSMSGYMSGLKLQLERFAGPDNYQLAIVVVVVKD